MKATSGPVYTAVRSGYMNSVTPLLTAQWSLNRYYNTVVDNTPAEDDEGYDIELFPIDSIAMPNRPLSGINKGMVGQAVVSPTYTDTVPSNRYYICSTTDIYKYWQSPYPSVGTALASCAPMVQYRNEANTAGQLVSANKIVVGVENSWAYATASTIQVQLTVGGSWTTVVTNPTTPSNGRIEVWYNGTNWTTTPDYTHTIQIAGVRYVPTVMNKSASYFNLIELGAYLELNLTADIVDISDTTEMGDPDFITPLGTTSTNTATVTLFNDSGTYTNENASSPLYHLLDQNVQFNLKYVYDGTNAVQQFVLYTDTWTETLDSTSVSLVDFSKFLQEVKPPAILYQNMPVQEVIWRICDQIGFNNYVVTAVDLTAHTILDTFWTTGDKSAWEIFQELSRGTQTAIYFDSYGRLQIRTRDAAFNNTTPTTWTFRQNTLSGGTELADIVSLSDSDKYEANSVKVTYQPTGFSEVKGGVYPMEVIWEPPGDVVLRATPLVADCLIADTTLIMGGPESKTWPWTGIFQVDGEWISYTGKQYRYYDGSVRKYAVVTSQKQQARLDALSGAAYAHLNGYTGKFYLTERGLYNTSPMNHYVDMNGWTTTRKKNYSTTTSPASGVKQNKKESSITLTTRKTDNNNDLLYVWRGSPANNGYYYMGTRMMIEKGAYGDRQAGIFFNGTSTMGGGYFVDFVASSQLNGPKATRGQRNELVFYSQTAAGNRKRFGGDQVTLKDQSKDHKVGATIRRTIGAELNIIEGKWFNVDVYFKIDGSNNHVIQVWVDGRLCLDFTIPAGDPYLQAWNDKFGFFARGHTSASYEYIYGIARNDINYLDQEVFRDRITGGYIGNQWDRDWVYEKRKSGKKVKKKWHKEYVKYSQRYFDEFGPIVHEIREFDIKFDTSGMPVLNANILNSNEDQVIVADFSYTPTGAQFTLANTMRRNVVVNGSDTLTAGGNAIDQKLLVYGRPLIQKEAETITRKDDFNIKRRSLIETEYQSQWIQNSEDATALADWLINNWADSDSELTVEAFGNPLIEIADTVKVQHQSITTANSGYYVTGIETGFSGGELTSSFTLRKRG